MSVVQNIEGVSVKELFSLINDTSKIKSEAINIWTILIKYNGSLDKLKMYPDEDFIFKQLLDCINGYTHILKFEKNKNVGLEITMTFACSRDRNKVADISTKIMSFISASTYGLYEDIYPYIDVSTKSSFVIMQSPSPKRRSPSPKRRSPSPRRRSPSPKRRSPSPKRCSASPNCRSASPN